jgi:hypothetical protein
MSWRDIKFLTVPIGRTKLRLDTRLQHDDIYELILTNSSNKTVEVDWVSINP